MTTCTYCTKPITETSYKRQKRKTGKKKNSREVTLPYHWSCWDRKMNVGKRKERNARNPLGGFR